jgi:hypothetical protein
MPLFYARFLGRREVCNRSSLLEALELAHHLRNLTVLAAGVAELADALDSKSAMITIGTRMTAGKEFVAQSNKVQMNPPELSMKWQRLTDCLSERILLTPRWQGDGAPPRKQRRRAFGTTLTEPLQSFPFCPLRG